MWKCIGEITRVSVLGLNSGVGARARRFANDYPSYDRRTGYERMNELAEALSRQANELGIKTDLSYEFRRA